MFSVHTGGECYENEPQKSEIQGEAKGYSNAFFRDTEGTSRIHARGLKVLTSAFHRQFSSYARWMYLTELRVRADVHHAFHAGGRGTGTVIQSLHTEQQSAQK